MFRIRPVAPQDMEALIGLASATPEAPQWSRAVYDTFLAADPQHKCILIAEEGVRLLGFAAAQIVLDVCDLDSIVVDVTSRRNGVGRGLLHALFDWALTNRATRVQLEVRSGNTRAISFYTNSGFTREGIRRSYYRAPEEDAILFSYALESKSEA